MRLKNKIDVEVDLNNYDSDILEWVADEYGPEDVFEEKDLDAWAVGHGYTKEG